MSSGNRFPFSAVAGHEDLKLALVLAAVDRSIGGVLAYGERGTAKSTLARSFAALLGSARFVEFPIGATEEMVTGSIDVEAFLQSGEKRYLPGVLARADAGVLYVDEVNLLPDHLVDLLLDAAASGEVSVERDGISLKVSARFVLVGTMNPEEGELRPQLLDRFGLFVDVAGPSDARERAEIVRRRLDFDANPKRFVSQYSEADSALAGHISASAVAAVPRDLVERISRLCLELGLSGVRGDITCCKAAAALAGFEGRSEAAAADVARVAGMALTHRRRRDPLRGGYIERAELACALERALGEPAGSDEGRGEPARRGAGRAERGGGNEMRGELGGRDVMRGVLQGGTNGSQEGTACNGGSTEAGRAARGSQEGASTIGGSQEGARTARSSEDGTSSARGSQVGKDGGGRTTEAACERGRAEDGGLGTGGGGKRRAGDGQRQRKTAVTDGAAAQSTPVANASVFADAIAAGLHSSGAGWGTGGPGAAVQGRGKMSSGSAGRADGAGQTGGRTVRTVRPEKKGVSRLGTIDPAATAFAAATATALRSGLLPRQSPRPLAPNPDSLAGNGRAVAQVSPIVSIRREDLRLKVREAAATSLIVFAVDASGSMAARRRFELATALIEQLLYSAYENRNRVAVVSFKGGEATVLVQPTASLEVAVARLGDVSVGGRTPLAAGILKMLEVAEVAASRGLSPIGVLVSDGRATSGGTPGGGAGPFDAALAAARAVRVRDLPVAVLDMGRERRRSEALAQLAAEMGGVLLTADTGEYWQVAERIRSIGEGAG